jgi:hypothetical protein
VRAAIGIPLGAALAFLLIGTGFLNYDTAYSLLWGGDVLHGRRPDFDVPLAPTPHPLATALGMLLTPLGDAGQILWVVLAFLSLGALAWTTYELGAHWFGAAAGVVAAALILTRVPVLSFGVRAYFDIPYVALVLAAILAEARAKNPRLVLVLLGLAGLLRPEAWGFALAYLAFKRDVRLLPWAVAAPVIWMTHDGLIAGNPLHSLLDTQDNAQDLQRITGLDDVPLTVPRRLGEILREPGLLAAAAGGMLVLAFMRRRAALPIAAGVVSLGAFCVLAAAGLPILGRYLLLPAALLAVFAGAGVFGWRVLAPGHPWRRRWALLGGGLILVAAVFTPSQVNRIQSLRAAMGTQSEILADLHAISDRVACEPVAVPNHRPVPHVALWTGIRPAEIVSAQLEQPGRGSYLAPASARVERNFTLDPRDPKRLTAEIPPGFEQRARTPSWVLYARC